MPEGLPVNWMLPPSQTGLFEDAPTIGLALTATVVLADPVQPLLFVTVKMYLPAIAAVAEEIVGLCTLLVKLLGPVQA